MYKFHSLTIASFLCFLVVCGTNAHEIRPVSLHEEGPRIINGTLAAWEGTRYQVSVRLTDSDWFFGAGHICGGSLITHRVVLTAGHCIWNYYTRRLRNASEFTVVLGNLDRYVFNETTQIYNVSRIVMREEFDVNTFVADLAMLFLEGEVVFSERVYGIPLNHKQPLPDGLECQVSGWGLMETGLYADALMVVDVAIVNRTECAENYGEFIRDGMLCAGYMAGERDACSGDSGGPLVCGNQLAGIVSFGVGCAEPGFPGVYTDVAHYVDWIESEWDEPPCTTENDVNTENGANTLTGWSLMVIFVAVLLYAV